VTGQERGSALPAVVAGLGVLLLVGAALGVVGAIFVDHRRAEAAADLAALAGAVAVQHRADPCEAALRIAVANGASLSDCRIDGEDVVVTVGVAGPRWLGQRRDLEASARAGP